MCIRDRSFSECPSLMLTPSLLGILHLPPTSVPCLYPRESRLPPGFPLNGTWFPQAIHYRSLPTSSRQRNQSAVRATLLITYLGSVTASTSAGFPFSCTTAVSYTH